MAQQIGNYHYSDPTPVANWARNLLLVGVIAAIISILVTARQTGQLNELLDASRYIPTSSAWQELTVGDVYGESDMLLGVVLFIVKLIGSIAVLRWFYQIMANSWALTDYEMEFTPGQAVGCNFIPIANLWQPYLVMKSLWIENVEADGRRNSLVLWWTLWLITLALSLLSSMMILSESIGTVRMGLNISILGNAVSIALNLVLISIIRTITNAQIDRYEAHGEIALGNVPEIAWE